MPGLAGGRETYVIPKAKIGDVVSMTVFDRALTEELAGLETVSAKTIRRSAISTYLTGLDGVEGKRNAELGEKQGIENRVQIMGLLISAAIDQLGDGVKKLSITEISTFDGKQLAKHALRNFAESANLTPNRVFGMLEGWSRIITPLGSPDGAVVGPLITVLIDLERFSSELKHWLLFEIETPALMAQRVITAVEEVTTLARQVLQEIDQKAETMDTALRNWDSTAEFLDERVTRFSNILDGWERLIHRWDQATSFERVEQREAVESFALYHPMLPAEQYDGSTDLWVRLRESQMQLSDEFLKQQPNVDEEGAEVGATPVLTSGDLSSFDIEQ